MPRSLPIATQTVERYSLQAQAALWISHIARGAFHIPKKVNSAAPDQKLQTFGYHVP